MILPIVFTFLICIIISLVVFFYFSFLKQSQNEVFEDKETSCVNFSKTTEISDKVAIVQCSPLRENQKQKLQHYKMIDCRIYLDKYGHDAFCKYGCLGYGTCVSICPESAIIIKNGTAVITEKCNGCGTCVTACPQKIIKIINTNETFKQCSLPENEKKENCSSSCISCDKCKTKDFKSEYCPHMCLRKSPFILSKDFKFWDFSYNIFHRK